MQHSEEKFDTNTLQSAPKNRHQSGNVNVFVLGTAMIIAAMWLVFQQDGTSAPTLSVEQAASTPITQQLATRVALKDQEAMAEVVVTAPRVTQKPENFQRPAKAVALVEPKAPKTFWQSNS